MKRLSVISFGLALLASPLSAQSGAETCSKMRTEDRLGPLTYAQCQCNYSVAEQVLDDDMWALLYDAWHNGNDNIAKMEQLKPRSRVRRKMENLAGAIKKHCS